ncbi:hypothetical protein NEOLEDRAFT_1134485 [Neolentinus lepideus HHB14362 ss-1]|uniref:Uncharacterized protein n=1 Tax=Neolentinus lepideus HHB14362 ss-1 TaxID=1314782 RepID=A0A165S8V6_9AGAM|nr:hypothetical protein NEOLEDRAFT_1134485 [Neolentinus lepideus HHB14362 ss-1]
MYVPFISTSKRNIYRRKGGGGGGKGGSSGGGKSGGGSSSSGGSGRSSSGSGSGKTSSVPLSGGSAASGSRTATAYGNGGGKSITVPAGQPFAGRTAGSGTRNNIYGTQTYGSGYPGIASRGVAGLGFPFFFWPLTWGAGLGYGASYLHTHEYGDPNNSSRPGGPMYAATLPSATQNTTLHIISDNTTVVSLLSSVQSNCSSLLSSSISSPVPYNDSDPSAPRPEQAVQYYRASSIALTLDGYNDTAALTGGNDTTQQDVPLPSWVNMTLLDCVNQTIGAAAPLISSANTRWTAPNQQMVGFVALGWILWTLRFRI